MSRKLLVVTVTVLAILAWSVLAPAQCPGQPNDNGVCDTMYVEVYECDSLFAGESKRIRVPIFITSDIPNPNIDSIAGIVIPLCYASTNAAANVTIPWALNNTCVYPGPTIDNSIFRHMPDNATETYSNFMMTYSEDFMAWEWDTRILDLGTGDRFWLSVLPTGTADKGFPGGSRVLTATMTFSVEDTTIICLDSCFWAPASRLEFSRSDGVAYVPRHNLPYCFSVSHPGLGDCNADCVVDVGDVVYLVNYLYLGGTPPYPVEVGDANCDGVVDIGDVVFLINYLYRGGGPPNCP
jgi:hypothetical protein